MKRIKKGIGVSFDPATLHLFDRVLGKCRYINTVDDDEHPTCRLNGSPCDYLQCTREERISGIFFGQFESRSKFIEYCIEMVVTTAEADKQSLRFVYDLIDTLAERPSLAAKLRLFLEEFT